MIQRLPLQQKAASDAELLPALPPALTADEAQLFETQHPTGAKVPIFHAIQEFSGVQLSVHTQRAYRRDLDDFFAYLRTLGIWEDWTRLVTPLHVAQYRAYLVKSRGLAKSSVTRKLAVVKSFYKWGVARNWLQANPAELIRSFPQTQESKTGFLTDTEVASFLGRFGEMSTLGLGEALARTGVETLLMLGVRRSEACQIRAQDLEWLEQRWLVRIRGKGDRDRVLPLPERLIETWSAWFRRVSDEAPANDLDAAPVAWLDWIKRNAQQPLLVSSRAKTFDVSLSSSELARIVRKTARKAGLVNRVSPHMLRATAITHALDQGASHRGVQQMAGWTSPLMITRYDKRRKDPRFSAVYDLKYARKTVNDAAAPPESEQAASTTPPPSPKAAPVTPKNYETAEGRPLRPPGRGANLDLDEL